MVAEILGGALALVTAVALHGAVKIRRLEKDIQWMADAADKWSSDRDDLVAQSELLKRSNRSLNDTNRDLRAELDRVHAELNVQRDLAFKNISDAAKWRDHPSKLKAMASAAGKASAAARRAKKDAMTDKLRCEIARNANDSAVEA